MCILIYFTSSSFLKWKKKKKAQQPPYLLPPASQMTWRVPGKMWIGNLSPWLSLHMRMNDLESLPEQHIKSVRSPWGPVLKCVVEVIKKKKKSGGSL